MELTTWVQFPNEVVCDSLHANDLRKGMNPSVLPLAMGK